MSKFPLRLIFGAGGGLLYALLVWLMLWLAPYSSITGAMWMAALLPAAVLGEFLGLPPAGIHTPNTAALFAVLIAEGFILGLALWFAASAFRRLD